MIKEDPEVPALTPALKESLELARVIDELVKAAMASFGVESDPTVKSTAKMQTEPTNLNLLIISKFIIQTLWSFDYF